MESLAAPDAVLAVWATVLSVVVVGGLVLYKNYHPVALKKNEFQPFALVAKESLSHDTRRFTFALQSPRYQLGLPVGQHIKLRFTDADGKSHQRNYTPVTDNDTLGKVTFVIKIYMAGVNPKHPNGGVVSQHLDSLKIGETMDMMGPTGHMVWLGCGKFTLKLVKHPLQTRHATRINMICGGTGITPMLQILHAIFKDAGDKTSVSMIYANQTVDDILVRDELETLATNYSQRFRLHYTVDKAPEDGSWKYSVGFVNKQMMQDHLFPVDGVETQVFMCGPPPMIRYACLPALKELGFTEKEWFAF